MESKIESKNPIHVLMTSQLIFIHYCIAMVTPNKQFALVLCTYVYRIRYTRKHLVRVQDL